MNLKSVAGRPTLRRRIATCLAVVCLFFGCSAIEQPLPDSMAVSSLPADYLALRDENTWTYRVNTDGRERMFHLKCHGSDVRNLDGVETRYQFVYGDVEGFGDDVTKSIYAMAESGPREFYLDDFSGRFMHSPPVPLLPESIAVGARWNWVGEFAHGNDEGDAAAVLEVIAMEPLTIGDQTLDAVCVSEDINNGQYQIKRWLVQDVGMVRFAATKADNSGQQKSLTTMEIVLNQ